MRVHPAAELFPMMDDEQFKGLLEDIRENGLDESGLLTADGQILDGRNRYKACQMLGIPMEWSQLEHDSDLDPWKYVITKNLHRRHLTTSQRAMIAANMAKLERGGDRKTDDFKVSKDTLIDDAASALNVSPESVKRAKAVLQHGSDELIAAVNSGKVTVGKAAEIAKATAKSLKDNERPAGKAADDRATATTTIITAAGKESQIVKPKTVRFNSTNDSVDWANWTWNPVTGCEHGCKFCYAREIANSQRMAAYYPNKFEPTFHEYRLSAPKNMPRPSSDDARDCRVFVCSMADLFGKWVPDEWIRKVFDACLKSPEWEYLFLTKWPARYATMPLLERAWYGASVIQQSDVARVEKAMQAFETNCIKWISLEPMLEPIAFNDLSWCNLVVIGSQTATTQPDGFVPAFAPEFDWVVDVVNQCREFGVPYYLKENLGSSPGVRWPKSLPNVELSAV